MSGAQLFGGSKPRPPREVAQRLESELNALYELNRSGCLTAAEYEKFKAEKIAKARDDLQLPPIEPPARSRVAVVDVTSAVDTSRIYEDAPPVETLFPRAEDSKDRAL